MIAQSFIIGSAFGELQTVSASENVLEQRMQELQIPNAPGSFLGKDSLDDFFNDAAFAEVLSIEVMRNHILELWDKVGMFVTKFDATKFNVVKAFFQRPVHGEPDLVIEADTLAHDWDKMQNWHRRADPKQVMLNFLQDLMKYVVDVENFAYSHSPDNPRSGAVHAKTRDDFVPQMKALINGIEAVQTQGVQAAVDIISVLETLLFQRAYGPGPLSERQLFEKRQFSEIFEIIKEMMFDQTNEHHEKNIQRIEDIFLSFPEFQKFGVVYRSLKIGFKNIALQSGAFAAAPAVAPLPAAVIV
jgi:hypothetical protein